MLPAEYYAESEISVGPEFEIDVATMQLTRPDDTASGPGGATAVWAPPFPRLSVAVDFANLEGFEILVYQDLGGAKLRAAVELVSPANKDRPASRRTFAAKCAGYLKHGVGLVIVDIVTPRTTNLHAELFDVLAVNEAGAAWESPTDLYVTAYRPVTARKEPRVEVWPEVLALGRVLPTMPLWLRPDLSVPLLLEESYAHTCRSLRIPA